MFLEPNPQPIKAAMELLGMTTSTVRLPLMNCSPQVSEKVRQELETHNLL